MILRRIDIFLFLVVKTSSFRSLFSNQLVFHLLSPGGQDEAGRYYWERHGQVGKQIGKEEVV